ncbi:MAG: Rpn family recombination-promoting nuclease/putative transposase [Butyrivibrio sp.]|nr:Rpn family recombination-promoting nuclease/putative transposase [Butyrivibrio sp.]
MKEKDITANEYMSDPERFADVFNYFAFDGVPVIKPENLEEKEAAERIVIDELKKIIAYNKLRDIIKHCTVKADEHAMMVLLGIENQSELHYAMVIRNMLYDSINYSRQVQALAAKHKQNKDAKNSAEFLSGITPEDKILPVITLVINWSDQKWEAPRRLSDMFENPKSEIIKYVSDYSINLLDPHEIEDFNKFSTELGDVFELIKRQNEDGVFYDMQSRKGDDWSMTKESIKMVNMFTGANISTESAEGGKVKMCRLTQSILEDGIEKGIGQGRDEGITGAVMLLRGLGLDDKAISEKICEQYNLSPKQAKKYL